MEEQLITNRKTSKLNLSVTRGPYNSFNELREKHQSSMGIYRGINNSAYQIFTSLQRQIILNKLKGKFDLGVYVNKVRQNDLLNSYFKTLQIAPSKLSIYSLLQHYGAELPGIAGRTRRAFLSGPQS